MNWLLRGKGQSCRGGRRGEKKKTGEPGGFPSVAALPSCFLLDARISRRRRGVPGGAKREEKKGDLTRPLFPSFSTRRCHGKGRKKRKEKKEKKIARDPETG